MKFSGKVGFLTDEVECCPGVWRPEIIERSYIGDVIRNTRRLQISADKVNPDLTVSNQISVLSDLYAQQNWNTIAYVVWNGVKWKITDVDISTYPRIVLTLGGVYNEDTR